METDRPKTSARQTLTDLVLEFLEAAVHEFLFAWHVYPPEAFERRVLYSVPIHMSRHPLLCEYIHSMLAGCRSWIAKGELEKLSILLLSKTGRTIETLVIEPGWTQAFLAADDSQTLPLVELEEAFRAAMVALVAAKVSIGGANSSSANTFRILALTVEDAETRGTAVNEDDACNSWVLADPFWCQDQQKPKDISPIKSIHTDNSCIKMNIYMESTAADTTS